MSATDVHEGFWPNVAAPNSPPAAIEAGEQPIALEAPPQPMALEAAPTIAALEAGSAPDEAPTAIALEAAVEAPPVAEEAPAVEEPVAAEPVAAEPVAEEPASAEAAAEAVVSEPIALEAVTPLEAAVAAADEQAEAAAEIAAEATTPEDIAVGPVEVAEAPVEAAPVELEAVEAEATDVITDLAAELDDEQRVAMEDVIDLGDFGADPIETGIEAAQLTHLPMIEQATLGGGNLDAARATQPRTLAAHRELEAAVMTGTDTLTEFDRTLIGLIVAIENRSGYWQVHLRRRLERWCPVDEIDALAQDWTRTGLSVRERAMLAFAVKLTLVPGQMVEQDAQLLSTVGFDERDLLEIVDVIAYWGFATRVAEGLGVFVEPWFAQQHEPV